MPIQGRLQFFDLYDVSYLLGIPSSDASKVVLYLRSLSYVDKLSETRCCKPEPGRMARRRVFIKVLAIYPEPTKTQVPVRAPVFNSKIAGGK